MPKLRLAAIVAIVGLLSTGLGMPTQIKNAWDVISRINRSSLAVVNVEFAPHEELQFEQIQISVRNRGGGPIIIKRAEFVVDAVLRLVPPALASIPLQPTATYDVILPVATVSSPYSVSVSVSQAMKAGDFDKFAFRLGNDASPHGEPYIVVARIFLVFNEDDKRIAAGTVMFFVRHRAFMSDTVDDQYKNCLWWLNYRVMSRVTYALQSDEGKSVVVNRPLLELVKRPTQIRCGE